MEIPLYISFYSKFEDNIVYDVIFKFYNRIINESLSRGASGTIERLLVSELLKLEQEVTIIVRHTDYLNDETKNHKIIQNCECLEWVTIRPDTLIDEEEVGHCNTFVSPARSVIFDTGKTSRINVAHFMSELIVNDEAWTKWREKMPVIYNQE